MSLAASERANGEFAVRHAPAKIQAAMGISSTDNIKVAVRVRPRSATDQSNSPDCVVVAEVVHPTVRFNVHDAVLHR